MISKENQNKVLLNKIENCCEDYPAAYVVTYSSGRTWKVCPYCDSLEEFQLGRTSKTRLEKP